MKKVAIFSLSSLLLFTSCHSAGEGVMVGGQFGYILGSSIGAISGGWHGRNVGAIIGTVGGVVAGAAVGASVEAAQERRYEEAVQQRRQQAAERKEREQNRRSWHLTPEQEADQSGFDPTMRGDDRIVFDGLDDNTFVSPDGNTFDHQLSKARKPAIELRNALISDASGDGVLVRGEECTVMFEIMNNTSQPLYDVCPFVEDATANKHIKVSPNLRVESIAPHQGIRYTASIRADKKLKEGQIVVRVGVSQGQQGVIASQTQEMTLQTARK